GAQARRHESKSLLFLGAALRDAGDPTWDGHVRQAREIASRIGAVPIRDAAAALLDSGRAAAG
ncbi:MAG: hypothetical protein ACRDJM_01915, partial [Actinomycetota bacterium]